MRTIEIVRDVVVAATADALHIGGKRIPIAALHAFAAIGNEVWTAAGETSLLERFDLEGERIGEPLPLGAPGVAPRFMRGPSEAVWCGATTLRLIRDRNAIRAHQEACADLVLPISAGRVLVGDRATLALRENRAIRWSSQVAPNGSIVDGELLLEGQLAAVVLQRNEASTIVVISVRDGAIQHRFNVVDGVVRFATRRGVAAVMSARRRLSLIDLRYGRVLVEHELDDDIAEHAIDSAGERVVIRARDPHGEVYELDLAALATRPRTTRTSDVESEQPPAIESPRLASGTLPPPIASELSASDPFASNLTIGAFPALPKLERPAPLPADNLSAALDAQRELAIALVVRAIARGWDTGRIAFPDTRALPFRSEIVGAVGEQRGLATSDVDAAEQRVARARELVELLSRPPLDQLADTLGLCVLERKILLVVAAPLLWGELARLYGILANDTHRPLCDELLVTQILADEASPHEIAARLDVDAPLIRRGIVRATTGLARPFLSLIADPVVVQLLRGRLDHSRLPMTLCPATRTLAELHVATGIKDRVVAELARARGPLRIVIRGRPATGRRTLLAAIAAATGRDLGTLDVTAMVRGPRGSAEDLRIALQRAQLLGVLPCLDGHDRIPADDLDTREQVARVLREHPGPIAARSDSAAPLPFESGCVEIALPALDHAERLASWTANLARTRLAIGEVEPIADRYTIGPALISAACDEVAAEPLADPVGRLDIAIRQRLHKKLHTIADRIDRRATWSQIVLPSDVLDSLTELVGRIRHRRTVYDHWGFDRVMKSSRGITALFQGSPGTGKTVVASAIANELGLDLYRVDLSRVMSKWVGETERNLATLFDAAEDGQAIILFDEADSLFTKRTDVKSSNDRYANLEVNYLLQRLDSFEGIAILTTNLGTSIDPAFKRRMSFRLTFPFPDEDERVRLWHAHLPPEAPVRELDFSALAKRFKLSGGYIRNCALRAAFIAAEEGCRLAMPHFERAIQSEFRELGKLGNGGILE